MEDTAGAPRTTGQHCGWSRGDLQVNSRRQDWEGGLGPVPEGPGLPATQGSLYLLQGPIEEFLSRKVAQLES